MIITLVLLIWGKLNHYPVIIYQLTGKSLLWWAFVRSKLVWSQWQMYQLIHILIYFKLISKYPSVPLSIYPYWHPIQDWNQTHGQSHLTYITGTNGYMFLKNIFPGNLLFFLWIWPPWLLSMLIIGWWYCQDS